MSLFSPGGGARRFVKSRKTLRAECADLERDVIDMKNLLESADTALKLAVVSRDDFARQLEAAGARVTELETQVRDRSRLVSQNTALRAALANSRRVSSLGATERPSAAELAAAGRAMSDTVEMEALTLPSPPAHAPVTGNRVQTLAEAGSRGFLRPATVAAS